MRVAKLHLTRKHLDPAGRRFRAARAPRPAHTRKSTRRTQVRAARADLDSSQTPKTQYEANWDRIPPLGRQTLGSRTDPVPEPRQ